MISLDTENTTWSKGNAFDSRNFNVCISTYDGRDARVYWPETRGELGAILSEHSLVIFFNAKYDLHWLRKLGFSLPNRIWCCQVGEFGLCRQSSAYPSLDDCASKYNLQSKLSVIEEEYWSKGINTHEIPRHILAEYAAQDAILTYQVYLKQQELIPAHMHRLLSLQMQDLLVLEEMEWNGLHFDEEQSLKKAKEAETEIAAIQERLGIHHTIPCFNWASNDHLSALLYGGQVKETIKVPNGVYKTGAKAGLPKFQNQVVTYTLPRKYKPIRGSENKKEGTWSVDESYLRRLDSSDLIDGILKIKELQKLTSTYYEGLPALRQKLNYEPNTLHTQFNQVVARTGRLSSSNPNLQNLSEAAQEVFTSRYE